MGSRDNFGRLESRIREGFFVCVYSQKKEGGSRIKFGFLQEKASLIKIFIRAKTFILYKEQI